MRADAFTVTNVFMSDLYNDFRFFVSYLPAVQQSTMLYQKFLLKNFGQQSIEASTDHKNTAYRKGPKLWQIDRANSAEPGVWSGSPLFAIPSPSTRHIIVW